MSAARIEIHWDGPDAIPGIKDHRLSIGAFGPALRSLHVALRRIASGLVKDALGDSEYGNRGGRLAARAKAIDLELVKIFEGSLGLEMQCAYHEQVAPGENLAFPMEDSLPVRAIRRLIELIDLESRGQAANVPVRKFLKQLPQGLTRQSFEAWDGSVSLGKVQINRVDLPAIPESRFHTLCRSTGCVVGVGFEEGKTEVRFLDDERRRVTCPATGAPVEQALARRGRRDSAHMLRGGSPRLLWIRDSEKPLRLLDPQARADYLFTSWENTLHGLAK